MKEVKLKKINNQLQEELSIIVNRELKDDQINFVTITGVETNSDLSLAKVFFTTLDESQLETTLSALNKASSFIRTTLASRVKLRHTPKLEFIYDESISYARRIEDKIKSLNQEKTE